MNEVTQTPNGMRFTDHARTTLTVREIEEDESFPCCRCRTMMLPDDEHVVLKHKNENESIYCFACWSEFSGQIDWFFFYCAGVYSGHTKSLQCSQILHELLGNKFYYMHRIDRAYVFTDPALKVEQLELF
jgi:hypothetical protein